jgi:hypothetical protein
MSKSKDWRNDPPTEKQLNYLRSIGIDTTRIATKGEASDIIEDPARGTSMSLDAFREMRASEPRTRSSEDLKFRVDCWQDKFGEDGYFGYDFKRPNKQQVRVVIESLDQTNPGWDDTRRQGLIVDQVLQLETEAEQRFLAVFEQFHPQLRKASARRATAKRKSAAKQGCIVTILVVSAPVAAWLWRLTQ